MPAFYINTINAFLKDNTEHIIGKLTYQSGLAGFYQQVHKQTLSWSDEILIFKSAFTTLLSQTAGPSDWGILLEYPIARREKRIDAVIITGSAILVIEFKAGKENGDDQLMDYCLDLRDFHSESRHKIIIPILLSNEKKEKHRGLTSSNQIIQNIIYANPDNLSIILKMIFEQCVNSKTIDFQTWNNSSYNPTPTIIEAAQALFSGKSVVEISRSHAGIKNLTKTTNAIISAIETAQKNNEKIICFVTGVPGAGKTLAGLNIAHHTEFQQEEQSLATFLSGNGPLISVLREALSRDAHKRLKKVNATVKKKEQDRIIAFIENVHRFVDNYFLDKDAIPNNRIVIFDEAQRAWNAEHSMRKFKRPYSEAEMMFEVMDRHKEWSVIVALIGGGQEINTGEGGLREWGKNIEDKFPHWKVYISNELKEGSHSTGDQTLFESSPTNVTVVENPDLHLDVSIRSYKAEELSRWVRLVLLNKPIAAKDVLENFLTNYDIFITRNLDTAKKWLTSNCSGTRRMGLVASSGGRRLRAYGLDVKAELKEAEWFLNSRKDTRSSFYLEVPATEFAVQGLELDWVGVCWDGDLRRDKQGWDFKSFRGTEWTSVSAENQERRKYILNKYRVLLTRAREGMIIWIPEGDTRDRTRLPEIYNPIYTYLKDCGVKEI